MSSQKDNKTEGLRSFAPTQTEPSSRQSIFARQIALEVLREKKKLRINLVVLGVNACIWFTVMLLQFFVPKFLEPRIAFSWLFTTLFLVGLLGLVYSVMAWYRFTQEEKIHFFDYNEINTERLPIFAVDSYKRNIFWRTFVTWFAIFMYVVCLLAIGVFSFAQYAKDRATDDSPISLNILLLDIDIKSSDGLLLSLGLTITILIALAISVLGLQIFNYIQTTKKNARLNALFDIEKKIDKEDIRHYRRKINIICAIVFLMPIFITVLAFFIFKKLRKQS